MEGFKHLLIWFYHNWSLFVICAGLCTALCSRLKAWQRLTEDEKLSLAKKRLQETILNYLSDAELEYIGLSQSGKLKRSRVISQIYNDYPILGKVIDQKDLVAWIDELIDSALPSLRQVIENTDNIY